MVGYPLYFLDFPTEREADVRLHQSGRGNLVEKGREAVEIIPVYESHVVFCLVKALAEIYTGETSADNNYFFFLFPVCSIFFHNNAKKTILQTKEGIGYVFLTIRNNF